MKNRLLLVAGLLVGGLSAQTVFINEDFESGALPTNWSITTGATDGGFKFGTAAALSSQYFPITDNGSKITATNDDDCNCDKNNELLITDSVDLSTATTVYASFDLYYFDAAYNGDQEEAHLKASTDGGTTWTSVKQLSAAADWNTVFVDVSAYAGTGMTNVKFAITYSDGTGWNYGLGLDNFKVFVPYAKDFMATEIDLYETQGLTAAPFTISGSVMNVGSDTIDDYTVNYQIDGMGMVFSDNVTGAGVNPFTADNFSHATKWTPSSVGTYDVAVWCTSLDGANDMNTANDTTYKTITVVAAVAPRTTLIETFTSSTCPPCVPANTNYEALINDPVNAGRYTGLKYQMSWPGSGDPYFTAEGGVRRTAYAINAVPYMLIDGGWNQNGNSLTQNIMDSYQEVPSMATIDAQYLVTNKRVDISISIDAINDLPGSAYTLHTAIIEGKTTQNIGTNGETEFFNVMKKMLPNASGANMGTLTSGQQFTKAYSYTFNGNYRLPNNSSDEIDHAIEHSVEEFTDLKVLVWIQDNATGVIEQSAYANVSAISVEENKMENNINVYPNPATDIVNIDINAISNNNVTIQVINTLGQVVLSNVDINLTAGANAVQLNVSQLEAGIHIVSITSGNQVITKTISIVK